MARALRRSGLILALPALVGASTLLQWLAGRRLNGLWIMPDEAIYGERALSLWRHFSLPILHGQGAGYSVLYPAVAGFPLAVGSLDRGYASLKLLQALVMSLAAVPVYAYGRRVMPNGYALIGAALTLASPLLLYSGLLMTEVLYYPLSALTLLAIARAIETAATRAQLIALALIAAAVLTRVQAVVFFAIFAAAVLVEAAFARDYRRLRAFWPVWSLVVLAAAIAAVSPGAFGAYAGTLSGGYPLAASVRLVYYHLAYVVLMVAVVPVAALLILGVQAVRGRERDPGARAIVAVALCAVALVVVQVGMFAARYAPHLLGRDLAALPPILFLVFALWLARGSPRPPIVTSIVVLVVAAVVLAAPWSSLVAAQALPDTLGIAMFLSHEGLSPGTEVAIGVAIALVLFRFAPRRIALLLPAAVLAALVVTSISASNLVASKVRYDQMALVGTPRDWIQRATMSPVAYVFNGDLELWNVVWQQRFWNPRISQVVALAPYVVPGPLPSRQLDVPPDGDLGVREHLVVANDRDTFVGAPVAHQNRGVNEYGLTLWRLSGTPRISTISVGVKPNGDILGSATVTAYDCRGGQLQLTLLPKASAFVQVDLGGKRELNATLAGKTFWNGTVYVPNDYRTNVCTFTIRGGLLLGSTRIVFVR